MQRPTCIGMRVLSTSDAQVVFHAVSLGLLPRISRRLDTEERRSISSGCVYVWEERGASFETGFGIERWTDSIRWGPSRVRDEFLFYHEKEPVPIDMKHDITSEPEKIVFSSIQRYAPYRGILVKQTYSVFVETGFGRKKWHLIAYFTQDTVDALHTVGDHPLYPQLATLQVPLGLYKSARSFKARHTTYTLPPSPPRWPQDPSVKTLVVSPNSKDLAPLAYLKTLSPRPRHPIDEKALMSLPIGLACSRYLYP